MRKSRIIIIILGIVCLLAISDFFINQKKQNNVGEPNSQIKDASSVKLVRQEESVFFKNDKKQYTLKPVEIDKDNTNNKMFIMIDGKGIEDNIKINVYADDKKIFSATYKENGFEIPYDIEGDKVDLKVEIDYIGNIKENEESYAKIIWYANDVP